MEDAIKAFISFFARQHIAVNLAGLIAAAAGLAIFFLSPKEILPDIDFGAVQITTRVPGASPAEAEDLATIPLEDAVRNLAGVEKTTALSGDGISLITLELSSSLRNKQGAVQDIKDAVARAAVLLPPEAQAPEVKEITTREFPVITVSFSGDDFNAVRAAARAARDAFLLVRGAASVEALGYPGRVLWVELDKRKLDLYELPLLSVTQSLRDRNVSVPAGSRDLGRERVALRVVSRTGESDEVGRVIVRSGDIGQALSQSDRTRASGISGDGLCR